MIMNSKPLFSTFYLPTFEINMVIYNFILFISTRVLLGVSNLRLSLSPDIFPPKYKNRSAELTGARTEGGRMRSGIVSPPYSPWVPSYLSLVPWGPGFQTTQTIHGKLLKQLQCRATQILGTQLWLEWMHWTDYSLHWKLHGHRLLSTEWRMPSIMKSHIGAAETKMCAGTLYLIYKRERWNLNLLTFETKVSGDERLAYRPHFEI